MPLPCLQYPYYTSHHKTGLCELVLMLNPRLEHETQKEGFCIVSTDYAHNLL